MTETDDKPRLLTILAADMTPGDGEDAPARLDAAKESLAQRIAAHDGEVLRAEGGAVVAAFDSPVEAVRCALATQRAAAEDDPGPGQRMVLRLGIELEVGSGGAANGLAAMAEAGGVCLSAAVREQILGKLDPEAEGAAMTEFPAGEGGTPGHWRIAPPAPMPVPEIPIPVSQSAPRPEAEPELESTADSRPFPLMRLSLAIAAAAVAAAVYLVLLRPGPLPVEPLTTPVAPPPPSRVVGPTLPGRTFSPEQVPFVDAADRARLRAEYLTALPYKALAISRGNASFWYVHSAQTPGAADEAALESCRRNAPEPCELYASGADMVWDRPLPPVPPAPWLPADADRVVTPFDPALVPLAGPAMRQALQAEYVSRRPSKAVALARSGTVGYVTSRPTADDAVRAALEYCGDLTGTACAVIALNDSFMVPIPATMRVTGFFRPEPLPPFSAQDYKRLAEQYLMRGGWKAVSLGNDGRMGLSAGLASEQEAIDAAMADCRAAKPPSTGPGGVAAAVLGASQPECIVFALGIFTVESK